MKTKIIELLVENHPGVMSHITGLFARRAFNLEGILCGPVSNGSLSRVFLLVNANGRLPQILTQLQKLEDVREVSINDDFDLTLFYRLDELGTAASLM